MSRIVCSFSCGAASAVAFKVAISRYPDEEVIAVNAQVEEEHPDNRRFLWDCERWCGCPIHVVRNEKYEGSVRAVIRKRRFMAGVGGAPCSTALKKEPIREFSRPDDVFVIGYTKEEEERANRYIDANNDREVLFPLIEEGISKSDCYGILGKAGIELPEMYRLGFNNANCIGCVKGGMGYWNKIREVFPERFREMADLEESIGAKAFRHRSGALKGIRFGLKDLHPDQGRDVPEPDIECSAHCELVDVLYG